MHKFLHRLNKCVNKMNTKKYQTNKDRNKKKLLYTSYMHFSMRCFLVNLLNSDGVSASFLIELGSFVKNDAPLLKNSLSLLVLVMTSFLVFITGSTVVNLLISILV